MMTIIMSSGNNTICCILMRARDEWPKMKSICNFTYLALPLRRSLEQGIL